MAWPGPAPSPWRALLTTEGIGDGGTAPLPKQNIGLARAGLLLGWEEVTRRTEHVLHFKIYLFRDKSIPDLYFFARSR